MNVADTAEVTTTTDLRCDANPRRLFAKVQAGGDAPSYVDDGRLIEFSCRDCRQAIEETSGQKVRVLHRFNVIGELVETVEVPG